MADTTKPAVRVRARVFPAALATVMIALGAAIGWVSGYAGFFGALAGPNALLYDASVALLREKDARDAWPSTFVLLIDQATLDKPPWSQTPRALYHPWLAKIGREALDLGARKVGYDFVLALDPSALDISGADLRDHDAPLRALLGDEGHRVVIGSYPTFRPAEAYAQLVGRGGVGVLDLQIEEDGVVRSVATRLRLPSGRIEASFAELIAMPLEGEIAMRPQTRFLFFPRAPLRSAPNLSVERFEACLAAPGGKEKLATMLRGKNLLIGTGIVGEDLRRGPDRFMAQNARLVSPDDPCDAGGLEANFGDRNVVPGVLLQAAAVESARSEQTPDLAEPATRAIASASTAALALLVFFALSRRLSRLPAKRPALFSTTAVAFGGVIGAIVGLVIVFLAIEVAAIVHARLWLPLGHTLLLVSALGLLAIMSLAVRRDLALADLRASFGRYLPAKVVAAALERDETAGGEERQITALFADLRGFTPFCNARRGEPAEIIKALNQKFAAAQAVLDKYDACLDKFDGDAVIAFWNGVGEQPDHAALALAAAIELIENDRTPAGPDDDQLHFKCAVATGLAFVGSYGSRQKMNFSAIGEPMNLAARLEGLCNEYGVALIVAERTLEQALSESSPRQDVRAVIAANEFVPLGRAKPKGFPEDVAFLSARRKLDA